VFVLAHLLRGTTNNLVVLLVGQGIDGIASAFLYQVGTSLVDPHGVGIYGIASTSLYQAHIQRKSGTGVGEGLTLVDINIANAFLHQVCHCALSLVCVSPVIFGVAFGCQRLCSYHCLCYP
jgi:hypothetical protein